MLKRDHSSLMAAASTIPGVVSPDVRTVDVPRSGFEPEAVEVFDIPLDPDDILGASKNR